jgi:phosphatidylglycerophosphate synthase
MVTDILDGQIARHSATQTKLGQIADAEADFCLSLALTIVLLRNGALPLWVGLVIMLRFIVPLLAALLSYLAFASPVRFGSTVWGKYAGLAQCAYFLLLFMPTPLPPFVLLLKTPLLIILICLLIAALAAQIAANARVHRDSAKT